MSNETIKQDQAQSTSNYERDDMEDDFASLPIIKVCDKIQLDLPSPTALTISPLWLPMMIGNQGIAASHQEIPFRNDTKPTYPHTSLISLKAPWRTLGFGNSSTKDSELTFYRRFAELLDILFNGTDIKIADGEVGSKSSKTAIEINKALFHTPTYPRKIDLLLKLNESAAIELSSSEWKKSSVSETVILKQQTKNLKTNACILSTLRSLYCNQIKEVLAMDWIGNAGYLYRVEKSNEVFIASQVDLLVIPESLETLALFKDTLQSLFKLKYFMTDTSALLKQELCRIETAKKLTNIARNTAYIVNSNEFPYAYIPPAKKRKVSNASEQDDANEQSIESEQGNESD